MSQPEVSRPNFPEGYVDHPKTFVPWSHVEQRLTDAVNYWLCTVRHDGRPHSVPKWGVWVNGRLYFDGSPQTRHARNISGNPSVSMHLESGDDVVIIEGAAQILSKPSRALAILVSKAYRAKYAERYSPDPSQWDNGGLFEVVPRKVLAWTNFVEDPTKFLFVEADP